MNTNNYKFLIGASIIGLTITLVSSPAWGFDLTINPPLRLTLDGLSIDTGQFNLTGATGFFIDNTGNLASENLTPLPSPTNAIIGNSSTTRTLIPGIEDNKYQALNLIGFFDATNPDLNPANFDITLTNLPSNTTGDFTYFLPAQTGALSIFQLTDLGTSTDLNDNVNTFASVKPTLSVVNNNIVANQLPTGSVIGSSTGNNCAPPNVKFHGGGGGTPPANCVSVPESSTVFSLLTMGLMGAGLIVKRHQILT